jgi:hypothetical protein
MRKFILSVILLLIFSAFVNAQSTEKKGLGFTGLVRAVREEVARLENHSGQSTEGSRVLIASMVFDFQGNLTEQMMYKPDGSLSWKQGWMHTYDSAGNETRKVIYNAEGELIAVHVYTYDENGRKSKLIRYNPDDSIKFYREHLYDEKGRIKQEYDRNEDGSLIVRIVYIYNDKGQLIERAHYSPDDPLPYRFLYTYDEYGNIASFGGISAAGDTTFQDTMKYDKKGNLVKRVGSAGGKRTKILYSSYEFDSFGNWIKRKMVRTETNAGEKQIINEVAYRTITYY